LHSDSVEKTTGKTNKMPSKMETSPVLRVVAALLTTVAKRGGDKQRTEDLYAYDSRKVPACSVERYLARWMYYTEGGDNVAVIAAVYVDRVCTATGLQLHENNVHRVVLCALLLAAKWLEEQPFRMSHYAQVGAVTISELQQLEKDFLSHIKWNLHVSRTEQGQYLAAFKNHPAWQAPN